MTQSSESAVVVIGGGSTGAGIARDLSLRGADVTLVEQGTLTAGTTGRMHGLLHSGARYAVTDQHSARDCIQENWILRDIAAHCVEETGGLFVTRPEDSDDYFDRKLRACQECNIPTEVLTGAEARQREPYLDPDIDRAIAVPDAAVDPFRLVVANALAAENEGARIETHTEVTDLQVDTGDVVGVEIASTRSGGARSEVIEADHVVNATGAWAGQIAAMADLAVDVKPSKGVMVVMNCRQLDTVINRCVPKGDADIIVPHETTAILGTTDTIVDDPDAYEEERWEVDMMIDELAKLVPILRESRTLRSYWGVRPLYDPGHEGSDDPTGMTRDFFLIDHDERDGVTGLTSVVGGKFATYRKMAEVVSDHVGDRLGIDAPCQTAEISLPGSEDGDRLDAGMERFGLRSPIARRSRERLGSRAKAVLDVEQNSVVCDCEGVTGAEIDDAIEQCGRDLNGVRIRTRASMGNCQGGMCVLRMGARLYPEHDIDNVVEAVDELFQERWKGQRHALWGEQLSQAMLNHAYHAATLNRDRHPNMDEPIPFDRFAGGDSDADTQ